VGRTWSGLEKDACKRSGLSGRGQRRCAGPDVLWTWTLVKARQLLSSRVIIVYYRLFNVLFVVFVYL